MVYDVFYAQCNEQILETEVAMADNYLEKKYEDLQERKAKEQRLRQAAWKKRMEAYRKKLKEQAGQGSEQAQAQNDK